MPTRSSLHRRRMAGPTATNQPSHPARIDVDARRVTRLKCFHRHSRRHSAGLTEAVKRYLSPARGAIATTDRSGGTDATIRGSARPSMRSHPPRRAVSVGVAGNGRGLGGVSRRRCNGDRRRGRRRRRAAAVARRVRSASHQGSELTVRNQPGGAEPARGVRHTAHVLAMSARGTGAQLIDTAAVVVDDRMRHRRGAEVAAIDHPVAIGVGRFEERQLDLDGSPTSPPCSSNSATGCIDRYATPMGGNSPMSSAVMRCAVVLCTIPRSGIVSS